MLNKDDDILFLFKRKPIGSWAKSQKKESVRVYF